MPTNSNESLPIPRQALHCRIWRGLFPLAAFLLIGGARAGLPEGPGRAETAKLCIGCHQVEKSTSLRQDKDSWSTTLAKMVGFGMKATDAEFRTVLAYLAEHFPAGAIPPLNVNKARAIQFESRLSLKRSEAAKIIRYRKNNGDFKSIEDLKKVRGIDMAKIDAKKDSLVFLTNQTEPRP